jgi:DNA end-binding protein Ku
VHLDDGAPIEHRRYCSKEDEEVPYDEVVKGYEVKSGEYVVLEADEVKAAAGPRTKLIEVEHFVDAGYIDPVHYDKPYYLGPGKDGEDAYRLLTEALGRTGRAGIGRFTFHNREHLAAIRARDGVLTLHTMRFADELRAAKDIDVGSPRQKAGKREVDMAAKLLETLYEEFDPAAYDDEYREAVLEMIKRKAAGKEIAPPAEEAPGEEAELIAALQASLDAGHGGRRRRATPKKKAPRRRTRA